MASNGEKETNSPSQGNNLDSLVADLNLKFIFVGGKGGVGKTTSSAAIATQLSFNRKVLLVSTDPAHSLSDAFRSQFSSEPTSPNSAALPNLDVMEVDPSATVQAELGSWAALAKEFPGASDITDKIKSFQDWLSGIPGIDEATALASAISHIESGKYDLIVFDTAPTGHTLKLLALPDIIQVGIEKLESWQSTVWGYWETIKGFGKSGTSKVLVNAAKKAVAERLKTYKQGIQKVAKMLQDQERTRFVVVCIAEYLSICETRRLLQELKKCQVTASHIVVNQLIDDYLTSNEMEKVARILKTCGRGGYEENDLKAKMMNCCQLTSSRNAIQTKYLKELKSYPEVNSEEANLAVIEVPLLPSEVTGHDNILEFSRLLVSEGQEKRKINRRLDPSKQTTLYDFENGSDEEWIPKVGDTVTVQNLVKKPEYNGHVGKIVSYSEENGRYGVKFTMKGEKEGEDQVISLAIQRGNIARDASEPSEKKSKDNGAGGMSAKAEQIREKMDKYTKLLQDPEIAEMVEKNPKLGEAVKDVQANPMNFMKYMMDPEMAPFIQKAMSKLKGMAQSDLSM